MENAGRLRIGTCSWNYHSWEGLVYQPGKGSYLRQYGLGYDTAEIDRWFWSLFAGSEPRLPDPSTVQEYRVSVPNGFRFTVKVPNSITLTHHYRHGKTGPLRPNPHFLSPDLFAAFLRTIQPLHDRIGALIFQFEYLSRQKISSQDEFQSRVSRMFSAVHQFCRCPFPCTVETRNPAYLNDRYFAFLREVGAFPCLLQGYYLPDIRAVLAAREHWFREGDLAVIRLHGPDRSAIEKRTGKRWDQIVNPKDQELEEILKRIERLLGRGIDVYLNVNNHYEGSAPLTIAKIRKIRETAQG